MTRVCWGGGGIITGIHHRSLLETRLQLQVISPAPAQYRGRVLNVEPALNQRRIVI